MAYILSTLFPVFFVIALGYALTKGGFLSRGFLNELNKLVYFVALPALIVHELSAAEALSADILSSFLLYAAATLLVALIAMGTARLLGLDRWQYGTFIQAGFRGNIAFIGIPVLVYCLRGLPREEASPIIAEAIFIFAPIMVLYNILAVIALVGSQGDGSTRELKQACKRILTNPLILAALTGLLLFLMPFKLPGTVMETLDFVGRIAAPAALLCVGGGMAVVSMEGRYRSALVASLIKTGLTPAVVYLMTLPLSLRPETQLILMIYAACPTAVASYVMAKQMHGDEAMASGAIVLSTLLSAGSLAIIVGLFS